MCSSKTKIQNTHQKWWKRSKAGQISWNRVSKVRWRNKYVSGVNKSSWPALILSRRVVRNSPETCGFYQKHTIEAKMAKWHLNKYLFGHIFTKGIFRIITRHLWVICWLCSTHYIKEKWEWWEQRTVIVEVHMVSVLLLSRPCQSCTDLIVYQENSQVWLTVQLPLNNNVTTALVHLYSTLNK